MTRRALSLFGGADWRSRRKVLAPGFYSREDIKTPVKIAIVTLIMTAVNELWRLLDR